MLFTLLCVFVTLYLHFSCNCYITKEKKKKQEKKQQKKKNSTHDRFLTLMAALLHSTRLMASQVGRSSRLCRTSSSSSRLVIWPSPFSVLRLILSGDRFLANLGDADEKKCRFEPGNIYRYRLLAKYHDGPAKQTQTVRLGVLEGNREAPVQSNSRKNVQAITINHRVNYT